MLGKLFGEGAGDVIKAVADVADEYLKQMKKSVNSKKGWNSA